MIQASTLYIVATPIGNVLDITQRAIETLKQVDYIAAEDTRHSKMLLAKHNISTPLFSLHDHNEAQQAKYVLEQLSENRSIALISDAGTPLISDPGYVLVNEVRYAGFTVCAVPGPSALIAALSISGLPSQPFTFWGFLPVKSAARQSFLQGLDGCAQTHVFYESTHRLMDTLQDILEVYKGGIELAVAKELTKKHERVVRGPIEEVYRFFQDDEVLQKGEFVILLRTEANTELDADKEIDKHLRLFVKDLPLKQAVKFTVELTGENKNKIYEKALQLKANISDS